MALNLQPLRRVGSAMSMTSENGSCSSSPTTTMSRTTATPTNGALVPNLSLNDGEGIPEVNFTSAVGEVPGMDSTMSPRFQTASGFRIPQLTLGERTRLGSSLGAGGMATGRKSVRMSVPKLKMQGVASLFDSTNSSNALKSARDILTSARAEVAGQRTARYSTSASPQPQTVEELKRLLEDSEERALACAETGMQLLNRIHDLEEEIEDRDERIKDLEQQQESLGQEIRGLRMKLNDYKTDRLYSEDELLRMRKDKELLVQDGNETMSEAERILQNAKWAEMKAAQVLKDAKWVAENLPAVESIELAERLRIISEEEQQRTSAQHFFLKNCVLDATMLYKAVKRFCINPDQMEYQQQTYKTPANNIETYVLRRSKYLHRWRPYIMKLCMENYRLDFYSCRDGSLRNYMDLELLDWVETGTTTPEPGKGLQLAFDAGATVPGNPSGPLWMSGLTLHGTDTTFHLCLESNEAVEAWINALHP